MKNNILIVINDGFSARYVLNTKIMSIFLKRFNKIIILKNPNFKIDDFSFSNNRIIFEDLNTKKLIYFRNTFLNRIITQILKYSFIKGLDGNSIKEIRSIDIKSKVNQSPIKKLYFSIIILFSSLIGFSKLIRFFFFKLVNFYQKNKFHKDIYLKYKPIKVIVTSLGYFFPDNFIINEFKNYNCEIVSIILSWDNVTNKGMASLKPNKVLAWTKIMKNDLIKYHELREEKIIVTGNGYLEKHLQLRKNLPEKKDFIYLATKSPNAYPWNYEISDYLCKEISKNKKLNKFKLIIRLHPIYLRKKNNIFIYKEEFNKFKTLLKYNFVILDYPEINNTNLFFKNSSFDQNKTIDYLSKTCVLLNFFSTMVLEASIFDIPTINLCINGNEILIRSSRHDIIHDINEDHNQRIISYNGTKQVFKLENISSEIVLAIENKLKRSKGRNDIFKNEVEEITTEANENIGNSV